MATHPEVSQSQVRPVPGGIIEGRLRFFFVVNRRSGNYVKWLVQPRIGEFLTTEGVTGEVHYLRDSESLKRTLDDAYDRGFRHFVVVGGDGTVSLVANELRDRDCTIGIVPVGTSNMLAQLLGIPLGARHSLELLLVSHHVRRIDGLEVGGRLYFLNASAGLSSFSISDLRTEEKSYLKLLAYVLAVIRSMRKAKTRRFTITIDGRESTIEAAELFVDNAGALWMPQFRTSSARLDDGTAAVCYVRRGTPPELGNAILDVVLLRKRRQSIRFVASVDSVTVDCAERIPVQADGDVIGYTPVDIRVVPAAIKFLVPETD
jgi:diacylglycerol kinase (ATP)